MNNWETYSYVFDSVCRVLLFFYFIKGLQKKNTTSLIKITLCFFVLTIVFSLAYIINTPVWALELIRPFSLMVVIFYLYRIEIGYNAFLVLLYTLLCGCWGVMVSPLLLHTFHIQNPLAYELIDFLRFPIINIFRATSIILVKKFFLKIQPNGQMKLREAMILLIPGTVNQTILILIYSLMRTPQIAMFVTENAVGFYGLSLILVISTVFLLIAAEQYFRNEELRYRVRENAVLMEQQHILYEQNQKNNALIRQTYHDLKNHFNTLRAMPTEDAMKAYLETLSDSLRPAEQYFQTGNMVLDILLNQKYEICKQKDIRMVCTLSLQNIDFLTQTDVCSLFGNALDNAIEATEKCDSDPQKTIYVQGGCINGFISVRISNPTSEEIRWGNNGVPLTTKSDSGDHGYGIYSMKTVLEHLNGEMTFTQKDKIFSLTLLIPFPNCT